MKKLALALGSAVVLFAIGCADSQRDPGRDGSVADGQGGGAGGQGGAAGGGGGVGGGSGGSGGTGGSAGGGGTGGTGGTGGGGGAGGAGGTGGTGGGGGAGGTGGTGGAGGGGSTSDGTPKGLCATYEFPSFSKACSVDKDCVVVLHQINCCGTREAWGINAKEQSSFDTSEAGCEMAYPGCGCATLPTKAEDGKTSVDGSGADIAVACTGGSCKSYVK